MIIALIIQQKLGKGYKFMKDVIIVGAGGLGREVYTHSQPFTTGCHEWKIKGFIDDNLNALDKFTFKYPPIIGKTSEYIPSPNDRFVIAIASPAIKKKVVESLKQRGAIFERLIHPTSIVSPSAILGEGVVLPPFCFISNDSVIGDFATLNMNCTVGHDASLGAWTTLSCFCDVTGGVQIGEGVFFASHVTTVPKSRIGDWAKVGINSFVIGKIKSGDSVLGSPAVSILPKQ